MKITALKLKRQQKEITQELLAQKTNLLVRTYQRYESGERIPDVRTAIRIAEVLGVPMHQQFKDLFETPQRQLRETSPSKNNLQSNDTTE